MSSLYLGLLPASFRFHQYFSPFINKKEEWLLSETLVVVFLLLSSPFFVINFVLNSSVTRDGAVFVLYACFLKISK